MHLHGMLGLESLDKTLCHPFVSMLAVKLLLVIGLIWILVVEEIVREHDVIAAAKKMK